MSGTRQKIRQLQLAFMSDGGSGAFQADMRGTEPPAAKRSTESPADGEHWMEKVCRRENLWKALDKILANQGSAGMDGMTVKRLPYTWPTMAGDPRAVAPRDLQASTGEAGGIPNQTAGCGS